MHSRGKRRPRTGTVGALLAISVPALSYVHFTATSSPGIGVGPEHVLINSYHAGALFVAGLPLALLACSHIAHCRLRGVNSMRYSRHVSPR